MPRGFIIIIIKLDVCVQGILLMLLLFIILVFKIKFLVIKLGHWVVSLTPSLSCLFLCLKLISFSLYFELVHLDVSLLTHYKRSISHPIMLSVSFDIQFALGLQQDKVCLFLYSFRTSISSIPRSYVMVCGTRGL